MLNLVLLLQLFVHFETYFLKLNYKNIIFFNSGALLGKLKDGHDVTLEDGRVVSGLIGGIV